MLPPRWFNSRAVTQGWAVGKPVKSSSLLLSGWRLLGELLMPRTLQRTSLRCGGHCLPSFFWLLILLLLYVDVCLRIYIYIYIYSPIAPWPEPWFRRFPAILLTHGKCMHRKVPKSQAFVWIWYPTEIAIDCFSFFQIFISVRGYHRRRTIYKTMLHME